MNAMVWVRGTRLDNDGWQLPGWGWDDVEPVFRKMESGPMRVTRVAEPDEVSRVRGITGLRVADTSALPRIPRANTNAPATMVGERCANFILGCGDG
jgi:choline dehydrogenase-like flavoprotein